MVKHFTRDYIVELIRARQPELEAMGVQHLSIFGSAARDELTADSDVDVLVEVKRPIGLHFFSIQLRLQDCLQKKVDLTTSDGLHPKLRDTIIRQLYPVF